MSNTNEASEYSVTLENNKLDYGVRDVPSAFITISAGFQVKRLQLQIINNILFSLKILCSDRSDLFSHTPMNRIFIVIG